MSRKPARRAVVDHLAATGREGIVEPGLFPGTCHVKWALPEPAPLVSILIPNKDHVEDLETCLHSLYAKTFYENFEVIVIENNSTDPATRAYYGKLRDRYERCRVVGYSGSFNFSRINNFGRKFALGKFLLLLNNDIEVINGNWADRACRRGQPARRRGLRRNALLPRRYNPARRHHHRPWRPTRATATNTTSARQRIYVQAGHRAGFFGRDGGLPACAHRGV